MKVSLCIPYHNSKNTAFYFSRLFNSIKTQTYSNYELIITNEGNFAKNHNAALHSATGDVVQFLGIDDYFAHDKAIENIVSAFTNGAVWHISACLHDDGGVVGRPHTPYWTDDIFVGNNRLGGVSTLSMLRNSSISFEEPLSWLVDVDIYYRLYLKYGIPSLGKTHDVVINTTMERTSNTLSDSAKIAEINYLVKKYAK